jgi:hypothetical protein
MKMRRLGYSVAEVGRGGRGRTVDVSPGTRRTTIIWMPWGFWKEVGTKGTRALIHSGGGASALTGILEIIGKRGEEHEETVR